MSGFSYLARCFKVYPHAACVSALFLFIAKQYPTKLNHFSRIRLLVTAWTAAHQAPPSMGFSRQEYWSGAPLPSCFHHPLVTTSLLQQRWHLLTGHRHCRCPQTCLSKRSGISRKLSWSVIHKITLGSSCGQCSYSGRRCAKEPTATPLL